MKNLNSFNEFVAESKNTTATFSTAEGSYDKAEIIVKANGCLPGGYNPNAYVLYTNNHTVPFLNYASKEWKNSLVSRNGKSAYICPFEGENCENDFENAVAENRLKILLFMKNVRGDKKFRFIGEYVLDVEESRAEKMWVYYRIATEAAAEPFVAYRLKGHVINM